MAIYEPRPRGTYSPAFFPPLSTPVQPPPWIDPTPTLMRIADILERIAAALEAERA